MPLFTPDPKMEDSEDVTPEDAPPLGDSSRCEQMGEIGEARVILGSTAGSVDTYKQKRSL
jgi:hypothetical protein